MTEDVRLQVLSPDTALKVAAKTVCKFCYGGDGGCVDCPLEGYADADYGRNGYLELATLCAVADDIEEEQDNG